MVPRHILAALDKKKFVSEKVKTWIIENGVKTGSRIFGGFEKGESDTDWILPPLPASMALDFSTYMTIPDHEYDHNEFCSHYIKTADDGIWNLLIMRTRASFTKWVVATRALRRLKNEPEIEIALQVKNIRVELFEAIMIVVAAGVHIENRPDPITDDDNIPF